MSPIYIKDDSFFLVPRLFSSSIVSLYFCFHFCITVSLFYEKDTLRLGCYISNNNSFFNFLFMCDNSLSLLKAINLEDMKQFLVEPLKVDAITRGGHIHDTPVLTRANLNKPNKGEYLERSIYAAELLQENIFPEEGGFNTHPYSILKKIGS